MGTAGGSAMREYERRKLAREARVKAALGKTLGGFALAIRGDTQSTSAWKRGAIGESKLASALADLPGVRVLSDRRVPRTRGNIDHLVIAPSGVFVVDAKLHKGVIKVEDRGGWLQRDDRLIVGGRDRSPLADNMNWQVSAVRPVVSSAGSMFAEVPIEAVLCFVDGEWSFFTPTSYRGVRLEGARSIKRLLTSRQILTPMHVETLTGTLGRAFPPK